MPKTTTYTAMIPDASGRVKLEFGSMNNLDEVLDEVGRAVCFHFPLNKTYEGDPAFFLPLIRILLTGSGEYAQGPELETYLAVVEGRGYQSWNYQESQLFRMWIGGNFSSEEFTCFHRVR